MSAIVTDVNNNSINSLKRKATELENTVCDNNDAEEKIKDQIKCPICFVIPMNEIYMCISSHSVCKNCFETIPSKNMQKAEKECPICRKSVLSTQRNLMAENIIEHLNLSCDNTGCNFIGKKMLLLAHEKECIYEQRSCQFTNLGCNSKQSVVSLQEHESNCEFNFSLWNHEKMKAWIQQKLEFEQSLKQEMSLLQKTFHIQRQRFLALKAFSTFSLGNSLISHVTHKVQQTSENCLVPVGGNSEIPCLPPLDVYYNNNLCTKYRINSFKIILDNSNKIITCSFNINCTNAQNSHSHPKYATICLSSPDFFTYRSFCKVGNISNNVHPILLFSCEQPKVVQFDFKRDRMLFGPVSFDRFSAICVAPHSCILSIGILLSD